MEETKEVISKHPCEILKTGTQDEIKAYLTTLNNLSIPEIIPILKNTKDQDDYFLLYYVWQKFNLIRECGFQYIIDAANTANASAKITLFKACDEQDDTVRLRRFLNEGMDPRLLNYYFNVDAYVAQHYDDIDNSMDNIYYARAVFLLEYGAPASEQTLRKLKRYEHAENQSPRRVILGDSPIFSRGVKNTGSFPEELMPMPGMCVPKTSPRNE